MADRTFVIIKPDAVERGLAGEIIARFERKGLRIVAMELRTIDADDGRRHYAEHEGKPFYPSCIDFIGRSPAVTLVLEGPEDTWKVVRTLMGVTNPREAAPGTIRGDYGVAADREPGPRQRRPRVGRPRDRHLLPGSLSRPLPAAMASERPSRVGLPPDPGPETRGGPCLRTTR